MKGAKWPLNERNLMQQWCQSFADSVIRLFYLPIGCMRVYIIVDWQCPFVSILHQTVASAALSLPPYSNQ